MSHLEELLKSDLDVQQTLLDIRASYALQINILEPGNPY